MSRNEGAQGCKIEKRHVHTLREDETRQLSRLCFKSGLMFPRLENERGRRGSESLVCLAKIDGKIIGWGLLRIFKYSRGRKKHSDICVYVRPKYRDLGIGESLFGKMKKEAKKIGAIDVEVLASDRRSYNFFIKCGLLVPFQFRSIILNTKL